MKLKRYVLDDHLRSEMPKGDWVLYADAEVVEKENAVLRARVAELSARNAELERKDGFGDGYLTALVKENDRRGEVIKELAQKLATLEAPPVVSEGWEVRTVFDHWEAQWTRWPTQAPTPAVLRALAWAIEHDQRPPHASDGKEGGE